MTCAGGKHSFLSTHPDTGHGRLRAWPWWLHTSPHDRLHTSNTALVWSIKKSATPPEDEIRMFPSWAFWERGKQQLSISNHSPAGGAARQVQCCKAPSPNLGPSSCIVRCLHSQHPCCWCHSPAGGPGAGANPPQLSRKRWPSKTNLEPKLSSWPSVCSPGENFWVQENNPKDLKIALNFFNRAVVF